MYKVLYYTDNIGDWCNGIIFMIKNIMINYTKLYIVKHYGMINID